MGVEAKPLPQILRFGKASRIGLCFGITCQVIELLKLIIKAVVQGWYFGRDSHNQFTSIHYKKILPRFVLKLLILDLYRF
jgi:hypothetical protein